MDKFVQQIGTSPYAVVLGLLLSAIPIYIIAIKAIWNLFLFSKGVYRAGLHRQLSIIKFKNAKTAYTITNMDEYIEYIFTISYKRVTVLAVYILYSLFVNFTIISSVYMASPEYPVNKAVLIVIFNCIII